MKHRFNRAIGLLMLLMTIGIESSCKNTQHIQPIRPNNEKTWLDTLNQYKENMKSAWLKGPAAPIRLYSEGKDSSYYYGLKSQDEVMSCTIYPLEVYQLDTLWEKKLNENHALQIRDLMTLDRSRAAFFAIKDNRCNYFVTETYKNGNWKWSSYGAPYKSGSDSIDLILQDQKTRLFVIYDPKTVSNYISCEKSGEIMYVDKFGSRSPFRDFLLGKDHH